ncbi:GNAT family N-acetyltransferase [Butyrivibrio sp.]|uniref:GNAT family N-acetyltransferase n=1 Tax=Butyrivibrio sp. TaxID=28121 RepID=UPI0025C030FA|nr:GNAT family N-acetyltransferase [Butyrivibrio sp.]
MAVVSITGGLIEDLYVLPELQNQGYGTALLDYVIAIIRKEEHAHTLDFLQKRKLSYRKCKPNKRQGISFFVTIFRKARTADYSQMRVMYLITADQYNEYTGENISLGEDEIFRYSSADKVKEGSFSIFGKDYQVKEKIGNECLVETFDPSMGLFGKEIIVVSDENAVDALIDAKNMCLNGESALFDGYDDCYLGFNVPKDIDQSKVDIVRNELSSKLGNAQDLVKSA